MLESCSWWGSSRTVFVLWFYSLSVLALETLQDTTYACALPAVDTDAD